MLGINYILNYKGLNNDELSVGDYAKKFKLFVILSDLVEYEGQKITKFISGLKIEIR